MNTIFDFEQPAYKRFRDIYKERTRNVVVLVGSGLSKPAGLPDWKGLKDILIDQAYVKAKSFDIADQDAYTKKVKAISTIADYWVLFEELKEVMGEESYVAAIKHIFATADTVKIPNCYNQIWNLNIGGIITVNIDRLATRAFQETMKNSKRRIS
ncbi:hypothetical protein HY768_01635 [candidate division TA06 bacterium]|uniref:Deacetylase sirtuin-type domain-containing protein n=1 Tax=candidate division TA06 bacterium TaxID=2250710 RepID=A0A933I914_UNCT6|nr:hypothetical protein [candidate division TA06 bacterium]